VRVSHTGGIIRDLVLSTRFQLNPRTLPELQAGQNTIEYSSSDRERWELPVSSPGFSKVLTNLAPVVSDGQTYFTNKGDRPGDIVFEITAPDGGDISGFDAGARFLDLRDGLAPDKFTAEVRKVSAWPAPGQKQSASLAWSASIEGPFRTLWTYDPQLTWKDGDAIERTLRWPEVDRQVDSLPKGTRRVYVRYSIQGLAMDSPRAAAIRGGGQARNPLEITHVWTQNGNRRARTARADAGERQKSYAIEIPLDSSVVNEALIFENAGKR
jgi:hypothetical protein